MKMWPRLRSVVMSRSRGRFSKAEKMKVKDT